MLLFVRDLWLRAVVIIPIANLNICVSVHEKSYRFRGLLRDHFGVDKIFFVTWLVRDIFLCLLKLGPQIFSFVKKYHCKIISLKKYFPWKNIMEKISVNCVLLIYLLVVCDKIFKDMKKYLYISDWHLLPKWVWSNSLCLFLSLMFVVWWDKIFKNMKKYLYV